MKVKVYCRMPMEIVEEYDPDEIIMDGEDYNKKAVKKLVKDLLKQLPKKSEIYSVYSTDYEEYIYEKN